MVDVERELLSMASTDVESIIRQASFNQMTVEQYLNEIKKLQQNENDVANPNYICRKCAIWLGAVWPECHVATMHQGTCVYCDFITSLASIDDWDWPAGSDRPKVVGGGRD